MIGKSLCHYRILSLLGAGGMGEVYVAEDTRLKRNVALKVLPSHTAGDPASLLRFQREAEAVAALDHPNIVTIYSIESGSPDGEGAEVHFFTMQLVEGEQLNRQIPAGGLPAGKLLDLATQLADALSAAHEKGILHRDLKPGNIIVGSEGRVRVLDFGLAKLRHGPEEPVDEEAQTVDANVMTREGALLGTIPYMSPEQIRGQQVDQRSDLFSLGIVLHEMCLGERPFHGDNTGDMMSAILRDTPPVVSARRTDLPEELGAIVQRCLEKEPDRRYATAKMMHRDLMTARDGAASFAATASRRTTRTIPELQPPEKPSVAVLPFVSLSADPEQDYFASGLWADVNAELVKISGLFLISQTTTGKYKGRDASAQEVGRELGVRHVLEGTVRRSGNRIRLTAQLVETRSGQPIWAERYDRTLDDLFELQDELTEELVTALDVKLVRGEGQRIMRRSLKNPHAREIYYQALEALFTFKRDQILEARRRLEEVEELEPDSPLAPVFASLSHYFESTMQSGEGAQRALDLAMQAAQKAIDMDDPSGSAHMVQGMVHLARKNHEEAEVATEKALEGRPNCPWVYALKGAIYNYSGKPAQGIEMARLAIRHSPLSPAIFPAVLATAFYLQGRHGDAVVAAESTIDLEPETIEAQVILAAALVASGEPEHAGSVCREIFRIKSDFDLAGFAATQPYKDRKKLEALIAHLEGAGLT